MNEELGAQPSSLADARSSPGPSPARLIQSVVAVLLAIAGVAHLLLTPEHLSESALLGIGFAVAGVVQLVLAALVVARPSRYVFRAAILLSAVLIVLYAWNVLFGLPIVGPVASAMAEHGREAGGHAHEDGLAIGIGEPVDLVGVLTKAVELLTIIGSNFVLRKRRANDTGLSRGLARA